MADRIYVVDSLAEGETARLVRANSPAQAIRHVASKYTAQVATQEQLVTLVKAGANVENAGDE